MKTRKASQAAMGYMHNKAKFCAMGTVFQLETLPQMVLCLKYADSELSGIRLPEVLIQAGEVSLN